MGLEAGFLEIEPRELVDFLLRETGQIDRDAINPPELLAYLKLTPVLLDLERALPAHRRARRPTSTPPASAATASATCRPSGFCFLATGSWASIPV